VPTSWGRVSHAAREPDLRPRESTSPTPKSAIARMANAEDRDSGTAGGEISVNDVRGALSRHPCPDVSSWGAAAHRLP
jgi:hypothetical protein